MNAEGTGKINWKGVAYYNRLIDYLVQKGKAFNSYTIDFDYKNKI